MALLTNERVMISETELVNELSEKGYGEVDDGKLFLSPEEALYLKEKRKEFTVKNEKGKKLSEEDLRSIFTDLNDEFPRKYTVFKDMRNRGFCVRTGFKFGSHFRVYKRGERPGKGHAIWLLHAVPEEYQCSFPELSRSIRLAQNVRKKMIYAIVDKEQDVTYYKMERMTP